MKGAKPILIPITTSRKPAVDGWRNLEMVNRTETNAGPVPERPAEHTQPENQQQQGNAHNGIGAEVALDPRAACSPGQQSRNCRVVAGKYAKTQYLDTGKDHETGGSKGIDAQ